MGFTTILYGAGSWGTLSSFFFSLSALFSDIILIRLALTLAYVSPGGRTGPRCMGRHVQACCAEILQQSAYAMRHVLHAACAALPACLLPPGSTFH